MVAVGLIPELFRNYAADVDETTGEYPNVEVDEMQVDDVVMGDESDESTLGRKAALEAIVHDDPAFWQAFFATLAETNKLSDVWTIATDRMLATEAGDSVIPDSAHNKLLTNLHRTSPVIVREFLVCEAKKESDNVFRELYEKDRTWESIYNGSEEYAFQKLTDQVVESVGLFKRLMPITYGMVDNLLMSENEIKQIAMDD